MNPGSFYIMGTSLYSFIMALLFCSGMALVSAILAHKPGFIKNYGGRYLLVMMLAGVLRMVFSFEFPYSITIHSYHIWPLLQNVFRAELLTAFGRSVNLNNLLLTAWIAGSTVIIVRLLVLMIMQNRRINHLVSLPNARMTEIMDEVIMETKAPKKYRMIVSEKIKSPQMTGFFVPVILIPNSPYTDSELKYILRHEWGHYCHKDIWVKMALNVICAILWWNPLVYVLKKNMDYMLEIKCDQLIADSLDDNGRVEYVESTLNVIKRVNGNLPKMPVQSLGFVSTLKEPKIVQRCELVLFPPRKNRKRMNVAFCTVLACLVLLSYVFILQPASLEPPDAEGSFTLSAENAYLIDEGDGTYTMIVDNEVFGMVPEEVLGDIPYIDLPIQTGE